MLNNNIKFNELVGAALEGLYTHGGVFHADDLLSTALLQMSGVTSKNPERVFAGKLVGKKGLAFDIGNGVEGFEGIVIDHHDNTCPVYPDGRKAAAFGQLCEIIIPEIWGDDVYEWLLPTIQEIDEQDCTGKVESLGGSRHPISSMLRSFNPTWVEGSSPANVNALFNSALAVASAILKSWIANAIRNCVANKEAVEQLQNATIEDGVLILDGGGLPWRSLTDCLTMISPDTSGRNPGCWTCSTTTAAGAVIPAEVSGWAECNFRHPAGFFGVFSTKESALAAGKLSLKNVEA